MKLLLGIAILSSQAACMTTSQTCSSTSCSSWSSLANDVPYLSWHTSFSVTHPSPPHSFPFWTKNHTITSSVVNTYKNLHELSHDMGIFPWKTFTSTSSLLIKHYNTNVSNQWTLTDILTQFQRTRTKNDNTINSNSNSHSNSNSNSNNISIKYVTARVHAFFAPRLLPRLMALPAFIFKLHPKILPMLRVNVQKNVKWSAHYDGHQNIILQLIGKKTWLLFESNIVLL